MSTKNTAPKDTSDNIVLAKSDDGTIQINFTIPFVKVAKAREEAGQELAKDIEIPGFRKGMAPLDKVLAAIPENTLLEKTLNKFLPALIAEAIKKYDLKLSMYPKFELVKAKDGENWQIRALTCEIPEIDLGDYKKVVSGALRAKTIWTPDKKEEAKKPSLEERQQTVIKALFDSIKITIPNVLIEEEVKVRLSKLLERLEKLGLSLESYLSSIGKTSQDVRNEYEKAAREAISLELILTKIAEKEGLKVDKSEIDKAIEASKADSTLSRELESPDKLKLLELILLRRKALDFLTSLV